MSGKKQNTGSRKHAVTDPLAPSPADGDQRAGFEEYSINSVC
jgi:hypothetical protein